MSYEGKILNKVEATLSFVSCVIAPKLINHKRSHTPIDRVEDLKAAYGVDITYQKAWRAKERALEILRGKPAEGYRQLPKYIHMLNSVYPNSYIRMHKTDEQEFMYLFIALRPLMRGYQFCRLVVVVDGSHLSGPYKGTFLSASTLDGAGCILSLAYGVVDTKNDAFWLWFFEQFKNAFGEREKMCVVSDRNESIIKSVVPSSEYIYVVYDYGKRFVVCLKRKTCSCGRFQFDEIPWSHAVAALKRNNVTNMHSYYSDYYKPEALTNTYEVPMIPMPDKEDWSAPKNVVAEVTLPPRYKRMPGRPRKGRMRNAGEKTSTSTNYCGCCGYEGHNRRTCTFYPKEK